MPYLRMQAQVMGAWLQRIGVRLAAPVLHQKQNGTTCIIHEDVRKRTSLMLQNMQAVPVVFGMVPLQQLREIAVVFNLRETQRRQ